jgi:hypothetical protein
LSPLVSMESEKRAVRDFHGVVKSEVEAKAFSPSRIDSHRLTRRMVEGYPRETDFISNQKIEITELNS